MLFHMLKFKHICIQYTIDIAMILIIYLLAEMEFYRNLTCPYETKSVFSAMILQLCIYHTSTMSTIAHRHRDTETWTHRHCDLSRCMLTIPFESSYFRYVEQIWNIQGNILYNYWKLASMNTNVFNTKQCWIVKKKGGGGIFVDSKYNFKTIWELAILAIYFFKYIFKSSKIWSFTSKRALAYLKLNKDL